MPILSELEERLATIEEHVYDALIDPLRWLKVAECARDAIGGSASTLAVRNKQDLMVADPVAATWDQQVSEEYLAHFAGHDLASQQKLAVPTGVPFILEQLVDLGMFRRTSFFNDWANKHGVAYLIGLTFDIDADHLGVLSIHRSTPKTEFGEFEREFIRRLAVPIRFALGQRRLRRELHMARGSLDRLSIGVVHLDERGRVAWCNERAEEILRQNDGLTVKNHKLCATRNDVAAELEEMIQAALGGEARPRGEDLVIPRHPGKTPLHVVATPLSREYSASLWGDYVPTAIFINDMQDDESRARDMYRMFRQVFKLTNIQAEIACKLVEGAKYKELVTPQRNQETVRSHIKAIYAKTNVSQRAKLQKLAHQIVMPMHSRRK